MRASIKYVGVPLHKSKSKVSCYSQKGNKFIIFIDTIILPLTFFFGETIADKTRAAMSHR